MSPRVSRRRFVLAAAGAVAATRMHATSQVLTAQVAVDRVRSRVNVAWRETTTDGFKAGDPGTPLTGIAVTVMPTLDVLRRAVLARHNLIVALEPTFYAMNDVPGPRANDPIYLAKRQFIDEQRLVVWRFGEHWAARRPSDTSTALAEALGWRDRRLTGSEQLYRVSDTTLGALARDVRSRLNARGGVRIVGRPDLAVRTVFVSAGTTDVPGLLTSLSRADAVIAGEPREWEAVPYVHDSWAAGQPKGMIAVGRMVSEAPGLLACAAWIRSLVAEVPVTPFPIDDPYWNPAS